MLSLLVLALAVLVIAAFVHSEIRSACSGFTLSNGMEVIVGRDEYGAIIRRFNSADAPATWKRWDHIILTTIRAEHPEEWRYLMRALRQETRSRVGTRDSERARRWAAFRII